MKRGAPCIKCGSAKILYIPGGHLEGQNHAIVSKFMALSGTNIRIARFVCTGCGYTEEWVDREDDMQKVKDLYSSSMR